MSHFRKRAVPVVFFNRDLNFEGADSIATDHIKAGREIADALFAAGHRRMACMQGPEGAPVSRLRMDGFVGRCAELGVDDVSRCVTDYSYASGWKVFLKFVAERGLPEAIFCTNDQLALGVMDACRFELGLSIPEDISVVGFDDVAEAGRPTYALTTIHQPIVDMALRAIELLSERIGNPDLETRSIRIPGQFIIRKSARIAVR
jgi:DNA-binding LacI/PurR family transcriptional regulator